MQLPSSLQSGSTLPITDPIAYQLTPLVRALARGLLIVCLLILPLYISIGLFGMLIGWILVCSVVMLIPFLLLTLYFLRRDRFQAAALSLTVGLILPIATVLITTGIRGGSPIFLGIAAPIIFVGPLVGRRGLLPVTIASMLFTVLIVMLEQRTPPLAGFLTFNNSAADLVISLVVIGTLGFFVDRTSAVLRQALIISLAREQDLAHLNEVLESQVAERAASLRDALRTVEQREVRLATTLNELQSSRATIQQLSAPVLPVLPGVLVAPLIGELDTERTLILMQNVLTAVEQQHAQHLALDITGVPFVDTQVAQVLLQTADAVQLLGARVLLVGIRPEVAQTLVSLGVNLGRIATYPDLEAALVTLIQQQRLRGVSSIIR